MLPHVVRFNAGDPATRRAYAELASAPEIACVSEGEELAVDALIERLNKLLNLAGLPRSLAECGVKRELIPTLAEEASGQWTATFNPRKVGVPEFVGLYEAAFEPRGNGA
jgi:alcohol dehydrogenase class IV